MGFLDWLRGGTKKDAVPAADEPPAHEHEHEHADGTTHAHTHAHEEGAEEKHTHEH